MKVFIAVLKLLIGVLILVLQAFICSGALMAWSLIWELGLNGSVIGILSVIYGCGSMLVYGYVLKCYDQKSNK